MAVEEDERNHLGFPELRSSDSTSSIEQDIDEQWLLDQKLLFLGPLIGEGGHSNVYEGLYKKTRVAIKMIKPGNTPDQNARRKEKFVREVLMLSRVQHENLVKFIGACKEPKMVLVTELLMGGSLKRFLRDMRPERLDLQLSINFALDISRVMECLHANGIIHRDLKPDNLLLAQDQKKLKLADFGLAREETVTEMMTAETGTYRWMAPELYSTVTLRRGDKKHYNHKVDIYSFGMVLSELLTNRIPFEGMSNLQAAYAAAFKNQRPTVEDIPKDLATLLESCWSENPASRPEFQDITYMLTNFLATLPSTKIIPPPMIEVGQSSYMTSDSPGTRHLMDRSRENEEIKPGRSSLGFLGCFNECFS